jgi:hypothetical protein
MYKPYKINRLKYPIHLTLVPWLLGILIVCVGGTAYATEPHIHAGSYYVHDYSGFCASRANKSYASGCNVHISTTDTNKGNNKPRLFTIVNESSNVQRIDALNGAKVSTAISGPISSLIYIVGTYPTTGNRYYAIKVGDQYFAAYTRPDGPTYKWRILNDVDHPWQACSSTATFSSTTGCSDLLTVISPTFTASFNPDSILPAQTSTLTFTISNINASALTGLNFTNAFPAGMVIATPVNTGGTCNSITTSAVSGGSSFNMTGGTIAGNTTCTVTIDVTATTAGTKNNNAINISSIESEVGSDDAAATLTVKINQTITFNDPADQTFSVDGTFTAPATSDSGLPVSIVSTTTSVCTITGATVTMVSAGNCSLTASQAGDSNYNAASDVTQTVTIDKASQGITFAKPANQTFSVGGTFNAPASSSSGLAVSIVSNTAGVCTVTGTTVTMVNAGNCSLTASQAGNSNYNVASDVTQTVTIDKASQGITFAKPANQTFSVGGTFNAPATSDSGLPVTIISNTTLVCTINNHMVTILSTGSCSLTASQPGDSNFTAATDVTQLVVINPGDPDGVDDLIENAVPNSGGTGFGDGNGDSVLDSTQAHVASFKTHDDKEFVTIVSNNLTLTNLYSTVLPIGDRPEEITFPYGLFGFTINGVVAGSTQVVDIYLPYNPTINSYWKKGNDNIWYNIATHIEHIGTTKTHITITLAEGGNLDTDTDPTTLTDPGGAGALAKPIPSLSFWMLIQLAALLGLVSLIILSQPTRKI